MAKILIVANNPVPYHSGIYREIYSQKRRGDRIIVVFDDSRGHTPVYVPDLNAEIKWEYPILKGYRYLILGETKGTLKVGFLKRFRFAHIAILRRFRPDFVMLQNYMTINNLLIALWCSLFGIPILLRGEAVENHLKRPKIFKKMLKKIYLSFWSRISLVVFYSCLANKKYWEIYGFSRKKLYPLSCAVDNDYFEKQFAKYKPFANSFRAELGIGKDAKVVITVGRLNSNKNVDLLIRTASTLRNIDDIHLLIVGSGPAEKQLKALCAEHKIAATFTGFININEISKFYTISDLFVLLSGYDYSPKVLNEAMLHELPIIVSSTAGTVSELVKKDNGIIVDITKEDELSSAMNGMLMSKHLSQKGIRSKKIVKQFNFKRNGSEFHDAVKMATRARG